MTHPRVALRLPLEGQRQQPGKAGSAAFPRLHGAHFNRN